MWKIYVMYGDLNSFKLEDDSRNIFPWLNRTKQ